MRRPIVLGKTNTKPTNAFEEATHIHYAVCVHFRCTYTSAHTIPRKLHSHEPFVQQRLTICRTKAANRTKHTYSICMTVCVWIHAATHVDASNNEMLRFLLFILLFSVSYMMFCGHTFNQTCGALQWNQPKWESFNWRQLWWLIVRRSSNVVRLVHGPRPFFTGCSMVNDILHPLMVSFVCSTCVLEKCMRTYA